MEVRSLKFSATIHSNARTLAFASWFDWSYEPIFPNFDASSSDRSRFDANVSRIEGAS